MDVSLEALIHRNGLAYQKRVGVERAWYSIVAVMADKVEVMIACKSVLAHHYLNEHMQDLVLRITRELHGDRVPKTYSNVGATYDPPFLIQRKLVAGSPLSMYRHHAPDLFLHGAKTKERAEWVMKTIRDTIKGPRPINALVSTAKNWENRVQEDLVTRWVSVLFSELYSKSKSLKSYGTMGGRCKKVEAGMGLDGVRVLHQAVPELKRRIQDLAATIDEAMRTTSTPWHADDNPTRLAKQAALLDNHDQAHAWHDLALPPSTSSDDDPYSDDDAESQLMDEWLQPMACSTDDDVDSDCDLLL